jgi:hypothetical protein
VGELIMPNKTIYIKDGDMWERAKTLAGKDGLSSVISEAIAEYVKRKERGEQDIKKYRIELGYEGAGPVVGASPDGELYARGGSTGRLSFEGRLLVKKDLPVPTTKGEQEEFSAPPELQTTFSVYKTKGGKLVLTANIDDTEGYQGTGTVHHYAVYTSIRQLKEDPQLLRVMTPDRAPFLDAVANETGEEWDVFIE